MARRYSTSAVAALTTRCFSCDWATAASYRALAVSLAAHAFVPSLVIGASLGLASPSNRIVPAVRRRLQETSAAGAVPVPAAINAKSGDSRKSILTGNHL